MSKPAATASAAAATSSSSSNSMMESSPPSDLPEVLSPEYFTALANCSEHERIPLLLMPEFTLPDHGDEGNAHAAAASGRGSGTSMSSSGQAATHVALDNLLHSSFSSINTNPDVHPSQAYQYLASIQSLHHSDDVKVFEQIRNAAAILAEQEGTRHQISASGILAKLHSVHHFHGVAHVEFLQCCIYASQYRYARRHFIPYPHPQSPSVAAVSNSTAAAASLPPSKSLSTNAGGGVQNYNPLHEQTYLRYHYLRGIILYNGSPSDLKSAINEWTYCIGTPAHASSAIMLSAYKKMILAKCLLCQYDDEEEMVEHFFSYDGEGQQGGGHSTSSSSSRKNNSQSSSGHRLPRRRRNREIYSHSRPDKFGTAGRKKTLEQELKTVLLFIPSGTSLSVEKILQMNFPDMDVYKELVEKFIKNESVIPMKESSHSDDQDVHIIDASGTDTDEGSTQMVTGSAETTGAATCVSLVPDIFHTDGNVEMVLKLIPVMKWRKLRALSKVYDNIPLSRLGHQLGFDNDAKCKEFLMEVGMCQSAAAASGDGRDNVPIELSIDDEAGVVYFDVDETDGEELMEKIAKCAALAKRVKQLDIDLASSQKYRSIVAKSTYSQKNKDSGVDSGKSLSVIDMS